MLITVFNEHFQRVDVLKKYTFAQYVDKLRDVGTFSVRLQMCPENNYFLDKTKTYYILFDGKVMGKVEKAVKDGDSDYEKTIELSGRLVSFVLTKRVLVRQQEYSGTTPVVVKNIVEKNMRAGGHTSKRFINIVVSFDDEAKTNAFDSIKVQRTGGHVLDAIVPLMEQSLIGFDMFPVVEDFHNETNIDGSNVTLKTETNISTWQFVVLTGRDKTRNNTEGNEPVIFSHSFSNLYRSTYSFDKEEEATFAYVAGQGEGDERIWKEVEKDNKSGWDRSEIFVDARDLQQSKADGTEITNDEYSALLEQRANEKFSEHIVFESYEGTIKTNDRRYVYGENFYKGDFVTVYDNEIGIVVDAQITEVTKSVQGSNEILDIEFGTKKIQIADKLRRKGVI